MFRTTTTTLACLLALALPAVAQVSEQEVEAAAGETLVLRHETGGSVTITGWDRSAVRIESEPTGRDHEHQTLDVSRTVSGVRVHTHAIEHGRDKRLGYRLTIQVPRRFDLDLESTGGALEIRDVEGRLEGSTMGGALDLSGLKGQLELSTMGGGITLVDSEVDGKVETMGGNVRMENVVGNVDGSSMGGNVILRNVRRRDGSSTGRTVNISTMGGNVEVADAAWGAKLSTMGGNIDVGSAREFVEAETMGGDIRIREVDGRVEAETMGGDVDVRLIGDPQADGRSVELESMGGDVVLTVPRNFSMAVDIEVELTPRKKDRYTIDSPEPLAIEEREESRHRGDTRIVRSATGSFNGGKNRVRIRTVNGNVTLRYDG